MHENSGDWLLGIGETPAVPDQAPRLLSIVCPFFNEERMVAVFFERLVPALDRSRTPYEIVCVNDGSRDRTLAELRAAQKRHRFTRVVDLSRNFGKEAALTAGLASARGEVVIPIDADLQDPPELIPELIAKWREGFEVVLASRVDRSRDSLAKRVSARWFYRVMRFVSDVDIPADVGDFRLLDSRVVAALLELKETRRFMKGLFSWVGFRTATVEYVREPRAGGKTKFNAWSLWNLAIEAVTSFSIVPLRVWTYLGSLLAIISFSYGMYILVRTLVLGVDVPGYASLFTAVLFLGGVQLIGLGILGEYLGRVYIETKRRPPYVIREVFEADEPHGL